MDESQRVCIHCGTWHEGICQLSRDAAVTGATLAQIVNGLNAWDQAVREYRELVEERDRLRAALEKIASKKLNEVTPLHRVDCFQIARAALKLTVK